MRRCRVELAGIGAFQAADIARELDACRLHAQANAEVRNFILARVADGIQHSGDAALAKSTRNQDAIIAFDLRFIFFGVRIFALGLQALGLDPMHIDF